MQLGNHEAWALVHGMFLGGIFLLAFSGGLSAFYGYRRQWLTPAGIRERIVRLDIGTSVMAVVAWLTVLTGTWVVYPWYRTPAPKGADLHNYPRAYLLAHPLLMNWHNFGMEWKEHVAWIAPILATVVAIGVLYYERRLAYEPGVRRLLEGIFIAAFVTAAIAGAFGALITKAAPIP